MSSILFSSLAISKDSSNINSFNSTSTRYSLAFISTLGHIENLLNINTAVENNIKLAASHIQALLNRVFSITYCQSLFRNLNYREYFIT